MLRYLCAVVLTMASLALAADPAPVDGPTHVPDTLDLATAKAIALRESPSLHMAAARVEQARARVKQARAGYFPGIGASAGVAKTWLDENTYRDLKHQATFAPFQTAFSTGASGQPSTQSPLMAAGRLANAIIGRHSIDDEISAYSAALTVQWLLFDGFAREFGHAAAKFGARESEAAQREATRLLLGAVGSTYFTAALARENIRVAEADKAFNQRLLKEAEARRSRGAGSLSDVLNFEVRANTAQAALIRAEQDYVVALTGLAELMGLPGGALNEDTHLAPLGEERPEELAAPDADALTGYALAHRPDLAQSRYAVGRTRHTAKAYRAPFYPSVSASAARTATLQNDRTIGQDDFVTTVGVNASYSLFAGGRHRARLLEAKAVQTEARHALARAEIAAAAEVRQAVVRLEAAQAQLALQRANGALVQKNRDLVEKEYRAGQTSLVRLNQAQRDLTSTQAQLASARVGLRLAAHGIETATGEIIAQ